MAKIRKECGRCGSTNIVVDAYVRWDEEKQDWVIANVFEYSICEDCETEEFLVDKEIQ